MGLIYVGAQWGRATLAGSGDGIDSFGQAKWQSTIWLLNLNDDTMCPHVWRWGKCAECVWLRGCKMQIGGLVREGWTFVSRKTGCASHILYHQWVRVGGVLCVRCVCVCIKREIKKDHERESKGRSRARSWERSREIYILREIDRAREI